MASLSNLKDMLVVFSTGTALALGLISLIVFFYGLGWALGSVELRLKHMLKNYQETRDD